MAAVFRRGRGSAKPSDVRVAIDTHGCRLNQFESDAMAEALQRAGHTVVEDLADAEVFVLNTCTVTHRADADARRAIRRARRDHPSLRVVMTGCHVDADPKAAAALPGLDAVLGNGRKAELNEVLETLGPADAPTLIAPSALARRLPFTPLPPAVAPRRSRAMLKVQDGCNYRCAFCIVPKVRGSSRSLGIAEVVKQARHMVAAGVPELVLTGVHLGTYGRDLRPRQRITDLVRALLPELKTARLRLSSIDPQEVDDELLALMAENPGTICRHLHLPVQAGDDGVLRRMRRGHTSRTFADLVHRATAAIPGIAIGSDVIAGFPGEDPLAFERGAALLRGLPLAYLHVFPFSARRDTPAATMADQVPDAERSRRVAVLRSISTAHTEQRQRAAVGRVADVVVHRRSRRDGRFEALTDDYLRVALPPEASSLAGQRVQVRIEGDGTQATVVDRSECDRPEARAHGA